ncbi:MAG: D-sedoheptulose 7-phosphate isomerase [Candidatus Omnitrophica bacterium]|nr:D-sedoheptulose 7-phosphate isomerase [Candidatus Omnitrophota bacterium]MCB9747695.1 D-sedoheptulose 7-phosphate isomerase [Candidatus Omnitrophota bacterium]
MKIQIQKIFKESINVKEQALEKNLSQMEAVINVVISAFKQNGKILFFGNGGSAADSQHIAAEFIGRFKKERVSLPAIALTTDTSILTALGNDYGYDVVFSRQIEGLGQKGDVAFGISTSGNSKNVIAGINKAKEKGLVTVSMTGGDGGALAKLTDYALIVPSSDTARIQESHICMAHTICELVENNL